MADGDNLIIGRNNEATSTTRLLRSGGLGVGRFHIQGPAFHVEDTVGTAIESVSDSGLAIDAASNTGAGVYGSSDSDIGVEGDSNSYIGVYGYSQTDTGAMGYSPAKDATGTSGIAPEGTGVSGYSSKTGGQFPIEGGSPGSGGGTGVQGTCDGTAGVGVRGSTSGIAAVGVWGEANNGYGVYAESDDVGVMAWNRRNSNLARLASYDSAGYFRGNVKVTGSIMKSGGGFRIDHPLSPAEKYLCHSFVESPDMKNVYDGVVRLNARGEATVILPSWFEALNTDFRYQLTPIGKASPGLHVQQEVAENRFTVAGGAPNTKVSWQITGIRADPWAESNRIPVEQNKTGTERGRYLHPEIYKKPRQAGIDPYESKKLSRSKGGGKSDIQLKVAELSKRKAKGGKKKSRGRR